MTRTRGETTATELRERRGFMDLTCFHYELGHTDVEVFASASELAERHGGCLAECGIAEVSIRLERVLLSDGEKRLARGDGFNMCAVSDESRRVSLVASLESRARYLRSRADFLRDALKSQASADARPDKSTLEPTFEPCPFCGDAPAQVDGRTRCVNSRCWIECHAPDATSWNKRAPRRRLPNLKDLLKPCPFCDGPASFWGDSIRCLDLDCLVVCRTAADQPVDEQILTWNERRGVK